MVLFALPRSVGRSITLTYFRGRNFRVSIKTRNLRNKLSRFADFGINFVEKLSRIEEKVYFRVKKLSLFADLNFPKVQTFAKKGKNREKHESFCP